MNTGNVCVSVQKQMQGFLCSYERSPLTTLTLLVAEMPIISQKPLEGLSGVLATERQHWGSKDHKNPGLVEMSTILFVDSMQILGPHAQRGQIFCPISQYKCEKSNMCCSKPNYAFKKYCVLKEKCTDLHKQHPTEY